MVTISPFSLGEMISDYSEICAGPAQQRSRSESTPQGSVGIDSLSVAITEITRIKPRLLPTRCWEAGVSSEKERWAFSEAL